MTPAPGKPPSARRRLEILQTRAASTGVAAATGVGRDGLSEGERGHDRTMGRFHRGRSPDDILLVFAGGEEANMSSVIPSWGPKVGSTAVTKVVR